MSAESVIYALAFSAIASVVCCIFLSLAFKDYLKRNANRAIVIKEIKKEIAKLKEELAELTKQIR